MKILTLTHVQHHLLYRGSLLKQMKLNRIEAKYIIGFKDRIIFIFENVIFMHLYILKTAST